MRRIINSTYISLDGVVERPDDWPSIGSRGATGDQLQIDLLLSCDALIMGRRTYEAFAPIWAGNSGDPFTDHINAMDKYVFSSSLKGADWARTSIVSGDFVAELRRLKEAPGKDIVHYGFGHLASTMLEHGLLDELRLWLHPLFAGRAEPGELLHRNGTSRVFELADATTLQNGIVVLTYRTSGEPA